MKKLELNGRILALFSLIFFSFFAQISAQSFQAITLDLQSGKINFEPGDVTKFKSGVETRIALNNAPGNEKFSVAFYGVGFLQEINHENAATLGTIMPNGQIRVVINSEGRFLKDNTKQISFPVSFTWLKDGEIGQFVSTSGAAISNPVSLGTEPVQSVVKVDHSDQSPFMDALNLAEFIRKKDHRLTSILAKYSREGVTDLAGLQQEFKSRNYILYREIRELNPKEVTPDRNQVAMEAGAQGSGPGLTGILSPTAAADAIGTFIAQRFKEELNIAFLDKFREDLQRDSVLQTLFPTTTALLINTEPYNYTTFLESMRESFQDDLESLATHAEELLQLSSVKQALQKSLPVGAYELLMTLTDIYQKINSGMHPADVISAINIEDIKNKDLKAAIELLQMVSNNLRDPNRMNGWVSPENLKRMQGDNLAKRLFLGLMLEKEEVLLQSINITISGTKQSLLDFLQSQSAIAGKFTEENLPSFGSNSEVQPAKRNIAMKQEMAAIDSMLKPIMVKADSLIQGLYELVDNVISRAQAIQSELKKLAELEGKPFDFQLFERYTRGVLGMVEEGMEIVKVIDPKFNFQTIETAVDVTKDLLKVAENVRIQRYGVAITNLVQILGEVLPESEGRKLVMKYGNFMVTLVNAETQEELLSALESAALPVGSYRIKRNSFVNISLNAYAGGFGGYEVLRHKSVPTSEKGAATMGFTAPVGLSFSLGTRRSGTTVPEKFAQNAWFYNKSGDKTYLTGRSWSIFISVIDVGAVTSFRLSNDSTALPVLSWRNLIAPGGYLVYGFGKIPVSMGVGVQYGPQLRAITVTDTVSSATINSSAFRANAFIAVDIPFLNFYTRNTQKNQNGSTASLGMTSSAGVPEMSFEEAKKGLMDVNKKLPTISKISFDGVSDMKGLIIAARRLRKNIVGQNNLNPKEKWEKLIVETDRITGLLPNP